MLGDLVLPDAALPYLIMPFPILPYLAIFYIIPSYSLIPHPTLNLTKRIISDALPYPALSYHILP